MIRHACFRSCCKIRTHRKAIAVIGPTCMCRCAAYLKKLWKLDLCKWNPSAAFTCSLQPMHAFVDASAFWLHALQHHGQHMISNQFSASCVHVCVCILPAVIIKTMRPGPSLSMPKCKRDDVEGFTIRCPRHINAFICDLRDGGQQECPHTDADADAN